MYIDKLYVYRYIERNYNCMSCNTYLLLCLFGMYYLHFIHITHIEGMVRKTNRGSVLKGGNASCSSVSLIRQRNVDMLADSLIYVS